MTQVSSSVQYHKVASNSLKPCWDVNLFRPKVDKIFASVLPIGRYPLSVSRISVIVCLSWLVSLTISVAVNLAYPCSYEPAAVLCIPLLPSAFFFTLFSFACFLFICLIIGFSATLVFLKKVIYSEMMTLQ